MPPVCQGTSSWVEAPESPPGPEGGGHGVRLGPSREGGRKTKTLCGQDRSSPCRRRGGARPGRNSSGLFQATLHREVLLRVRMRPASHGGRPLPCSGFSWFASRSTPASGLHLSHVGVTAPWEGSRTPRPGGTGSAPPGAQPELCLRDTCGLAPVSVSAGLPCAPRCPDSTTEPLPAALLPAGSPEPGAASVPSEWQPGRTLPEGRRHGLRKDVGCQRR